MRGESGVCLWRLDMTQVSQLTVSFSSTRPASSWRTCSCPWEQALTMSWSRGGGGGGGGGGGEKEKEGELIPERAKHKYYFERGDTF